VLATPSVPPSRMSMDQFMSRRSSSRLSNSDSSAGLAWIHSYCLACDTQTDGQTYCSQTCRLKEYEQRALPFVSKSDPETNTSLATCTISAPMIVRQAGRSGFIHLQRKTSRHSDDGNRPTASKPVEKGLEHDRRSASPHSTSGNSNTQLAGWHCRQRCLPPPELSRPTSCPPPPEVKISGVNIDNLKEYTRWLEVRRRPPNLVTGPRPADQRQL